MIYVKVNDTLYPAGVAGKTVDKQWDDRESKEITLEADFDTVDALFQDGTAWSIVNEYEVQAVDEQGELIFDESGNPVYTTERTEFDNSEFSIRGDLTVHTDGTCTVKMGKPTDLEDAYELLYGGIGA